MRDILKGIETAYVDAQTILTHLRDYQRPREHILRMVKRGELVRLKNGFYLVNNNIIIGGHRVIPYEQVANMLYGPSYVSLEWALSFYGMIPERVHTVTSMTLGKSKEFSTPVGNFCYYKILEKSYPFGITQKDSPDFVGGFLIATPEKALIDLVYKNCKGLNEEELQIELLESKRIDPNCFDDLDRKMLQAIAKNYKSKSVNSLVNLLGII